MMASERRVAVVGVGFRSPIGNTLDAMRQAFQNGHSGVEQMPHWSEMENLRTRVAGNCKTDLDAKSVPRKYRRSMGRVGLLATLAAQDAVSDSGVPADEIASPDCGVSFGSTTGSSQAQEDFLRQVFMKRDLRGLLSSSYLQFMSHTCAANVALRFATKGPLIASCTACTSGSQGVGFGYEQIKMGRATFMLTGGAEEMHIMDAAIFDILRATSTRYNDRPSQTPRPFDADRDGLVVGEGGACLVLEELDHARRRGARIYGEIKGYGTTCSGTHLTNSDVDGIASTMRAALDDAEMSADQIQHINAHATATETGDVAEAAAVHRVFGAEVPVSGLKGYMGHTLGASGALESIASLLMLGDQFIAPTHNLDNPDPACAPLQHVMGDARPHRFQIAMNNNFAFGGVNTSLIFSLI